MHFSATEPPGSAPGEMHVDACARSFQRALRASRGHGDEDQPCGGHCRVRSRALQA